MRRELEKLRSQSHRSSSAALPESISDLDVNLSSTYGPSSEPNHDFNFTCRELSLEGSVVEAEVATDALKM